MNSLLQRFLTAGVLTVWGTVLGAIYFTGRISAYLHPTFQPFALAAGITLIVLALLVLVAPNLEGGCGASNRSALGGILLALVLVGPLLIAFSTSQDSFGASTVSNRTYVRDIAQLPGAQPPATAETAPATVDPALPDESPAPAAGDPAAPDPTAFPKNAHGDLQAQVVDFLYAAQLPDMRGELENKRVEVIGQLMPAKTNNPRGDRYDVIRMFMTCCAADAQPVALPVAPAAKPDLREMTWVKITGTAAFPVIGGQHMPLIENATIEKTDPPEDTFLY